MKGMAEHYTDCSIGECCEDTKLFRIALRRFLFLIALYLLCYCTALSVVCIVLSVYACFVLVLYLVFWGAGLQGLPLVQPLLFD